MIKLFVLRLLESYFQHRWLYLLPIVLMAIGAGVYLYLAEPTYQAESVLYVQEETFLSDVTDVQNPSFTFATPANIIAGEFSELLLSDAFMRAIVGRTDKEVEFNKPDVDASEFLSQVRENVWVESLGENLVAIKAVDENAPIAKQLSEAAFHTYIQWKINTDREESLAAEEFYATLVDSYQAELDVAHDALRAYLGANPQPTRGDRPETEELEISLLTTDIDKAEARLENALEKLEDIQLVLRQSESNIRQRYFMIDAPELPNKPSLSMRDTAMTAILFLGAGAALSVGLLFGAMLLDRSFRLPVDVNYHLNLPILATVPTVDMAESRMAFNE
jgi:capsular polysaccharide biosynthesis protein